MKTSFYIQVYRERPIKDLLDHVTCRCSAALTSNMFNFAALTSNMLKVVKKKEIGRQC